MAGNFAGLSNYITNDIFIIGGLFMCKKLLLALLAITLTIVVLAGCSSTKKPAVNLEDDQTQEVEIVLVTPTDTQKDYNQVIAEVNKYLKQKLNCTLKITFQPM